MMLMIVSTGLPLDELTTVSSGTLTLMTAAGESFLLKWATMATLPPVVALS